MSNVLSKVDSGASEPDSRSIRVAENWAGDHFYGKICGNSAISGSVDEDYAASRWPVVAKVHEGVTRQRFIEYLNDMVCCIDDGFYFEATEL